MSYPNYINPYRYQGQFGSVPQNPGIAPSAANGDFGFGAQFGAALNGNGTMSPLMNMITGGLGGLFTSGLNFLGQYSQNKWNEKMWNMQNEYNTPEAQIQRFLDAGINPSAAVDSVLGGNGQTAGPVANGSGPQAGVDMANMMHNSSFNSVQMELFREQMSNVAADTKKKEAEENLIKSQDTAQQIENANRQTIIDSTLRQMTDKHNIDTATAHMLHNDAVLSDIMFNGKITQFWLQLAQAAQDLQNAEAEHKRILADIDLKYSEMSLNAQLAVESDARTQYTMKQKEVEEENRRFLAFRRNMISQYHWDPYGTTAQNIGMALAIGDTQSATYWSNQLGRFEAYNLGLGEDAKNYSAQENMGYQALLDMAKYFVGGMAAGKVASNAAPSTPIQVYPANTPIQTGYGSNTTITDVSGKPIGSKK